MRWTEERIKLLREALSRSWLRPGEATIILGVHRSTIHNYMRSGRIGVVYLGGSRKRSAVTADVLELLRDELEMLQAEDCPDRCPDDLASAIKRKINSEVLGTDQ